jgi:hypothetical protein
MKILHFKVFQQTAKERLVARAQSADAANLAPTTSSFQRWMMRVAIVSVEMLVI